MRTELKEYAEKHSWAKSMLSGQGFDSFENYSGPNLGDLVVVLSQSRDSDILSQSNFICALERLGGESKHVMVERFGHWACGWFDLILVNPKSSKHLKIAYDISESLKGYPVLDENDYYERENEYQSDFANGAKTDLAEAIALHFGLHNSKTLVNICYDLEMECQRYCGNDACIDIYTCRKPDDRDIKRLKEIVNQIADNYKKSRVFKALTAKLN